MKCQIMFSEGKKIKKKKKKKKKNSKCRLLIFLPRVPSVKKADDNIYSQFTTLLL